MSMDIVDNESHLAVAELAGVVEEHCCIAGAGQGIRFPCSLKLLSYLQFPALR